MLVKLNSPVTFKNKIPYEIDIPKDIQKKVKDYWNEFIKGKTGYWDGDIYLVTDIDYNQNILEIGTTKFSSLIYAQKNPDLTARSLFVAILTRCAS